MTSFRDARDFLLDARLDYERAYADFRWPDTETFNWALDWFDGTLAKESTSKDAVALWIVDGVSGSEVKLTFSELSTRSSSAAVMLRSLGVQRGDRILLLLDAVQELWEVMLGAMKLGAVVVPASILLTEGEIADRIKLGKIDHVITSGEYVHRVRSELVLGSQIIVGAVRDGWATFDLAQFEPQFTAERATNADDTLLLYFTSGTTRQPKLVRHTHRSYPVGHLSTMYWIGLLPGDLHLNISSPGWAKHAWSSVFAPWNAGAGVVVINQPKFDAPFILSEIQRIGVTTLCAPPTAWRLIVQEQLFGASGVLRELVGAGEPLNAEIIDQVRGAWGLTIRDGFGQTETTAIIGNSPGQPVKPGCMGRALPGYRVVLLDAASAASPNCGEVSLPLGNDRPAGLMAGYEEDGRAVELEGDFYGTSDIVECDADGVFKFIGRNDDVFKSSDYRISPFELESVLLEHPFVVEAAVIPWPDPQRLNVPKAFVILKGSVEPDERSAEDIFLALQSRLAPYKRIRILEFVDELPKTISGKIKRADLRRSIVRDDATEAGPRRFLEPSRLQFSRATRAGSVTPSTTD